jgi:hypothetical protein
MSVIYGTKTGGVALVNTGPKRQVRVGRRSGMDRTAHLVGGRHSEGAVLGIGAEDQWSEAGLKRGKGDILVPFWI